MNKDKWLLNISKIEDNNMWILKLIASNQDTLQVLGDSDIELDTIDAFITSNKFYTDVTNTQDKILKIINEDPMTLIASLLKLKNKFKDDIIYLDDFLSKLNLNKLKYYLKGNNIENKNFKFKNIGYSENRYINYETFNKQIEKYIKNIKNVENLSNEVASSLLISCKSAIEWSNVDLLKHSIGTPGDITNLGINLLKYKADSSTSMKNIPLQFLNDIFKVYNWSELSAILQEAFYTNTSFIIPIWKGKDDTINKLTISNLDTDSKKENALSYQVDNLLLDYETYKKSGVTESLVLIIYNLLNNVILRLMYLYNQFQLFIDKDKKLTIKERTILKHSLKYSIISLGKLVKDRVKDFFGINTDIENISDLSLYPVNKKVSNKSIYRIIGGIESIKSKDSCNPKFYPIVLEKYPDGKFNGKINIKETNRRLIKLLLGNNDEYVGGMIMTPNLSVRTIKVVILYINDLIDAKRKGIIKIDNYFNKIISGIKLQKAKGMAEQLQAAYKNIITEDNKLIKKTIIIETIFNITEHYKLLKLKEFEKLKHYLEVYNTIIKYTNRNNNNNDNKILTSNEGRNKIKKLAIIQKKLLLEYFAVKNTAYVYKLLSIKILESIKISLESRTNKIILPNSIKNSLNKNFTNINKKFNLKINNLNKNVNENKKLKKILATKYGEKIKYNKLGGDNSKKLNKILTKKFWNELEDNELESKQIYIPFHNNKSILSPTGYLNLLYGTINNSLDDKKKFIASNSSKGISKIIKNSYILVCNKTKDLCEPSNWRVINKDFLLDIKKGSVDNIRRKVYNLITNDTDYLSNTIIWNNNDSKALLYNVSKNFGKDLLKCQIIISREVLSKQLKKYHHRMLISNSLKSFISIK